MSMSLAELGEVSKAANPFGALKNLGKKTPGVSRSRQRVAAVQAKEAERRAAEKAQQAHLGRAYESANPKPVAPTPPPPPVAPVVPEAAKAGMSRRNKVLIGSGVGTAAIGGGGGALYLNRRNKTA